MKKTSKLLLLFAPLMFLWGNPQHEESPEHLEILFSVFPLESANWEGIYYAPTGDPVEKRSEVAFNPNERSLGYKYHGPPVLHFFRISHNEEGEPIPQVVGSVNLLSAQPNDNVILFFEPEPSTHRFQISVMPDSSEHFPNESIVFFNTMNVPFIGILNDSRFVLQPGLSSPLSVKEFLGRDVPIALAIRDNEDIHLVAKNNMRFFRDRRTILILRPPRRPGSLRIRTQRLTEFTGELASDPIVERD